MATPVFFIKRNDTSPPFTAFLTYRLDNGSDQPVDLTGATVKFLMRSMGGKLVRSTPATISGPPTNGSILYQWVQADTSKSGFFKVECEVTFPDGTITTFPNFLDATTGSAYGLINITEDLG